MCNHFNFIYKVIVVNYYHFEYDLTFFNVFNCFQYYHFTNLTHQNAF